ncbi:hypothetical protein [Reichenbachiella sp.]|uniref:hypothetical protein n=1 Tax=Reichenbachiella sp. TaxID=2184521 RepID=UPI003BB0D7A3
MPKNFLILISLVVFGCNRKHDAIEGRVWYPVKIESNYYPSALGLYAFEFGSDSTLTKYTLGTQHKVSSTLSRTEDEITFNIEQDSITVTYTVSGSNLIINFDSATTVYYSDSFYLNNTDLTEKLDQILVSKSWQLNNDLIEFHESLDKGYIKFELHDELLDATFHFKNSNYYIDHEVFAWGTNYFKGLNFLVFGNTIGDIENQFFIIESVTDSLISGYKFDKEGQQQMVQLFAMDNQNLKPAIIGSWNISSFEEISSDLNELWDTFGTQKGINVSDLDNMNLSFKFNSDSSFHFLSGNKVISMGKWHFDISGNVIYLIAENEDQEGMSYRTTYLSVISLNDHELVVYKKEDIIQAKRGGFQRKEFIETYKKGDN